MSSDCLRGFDLKYISNEKKAKSSQQYLNEDFVSELRLQYNMEFDNKKNMESKASSIITISGTVAALLFGFGAFIIKNLPPGYDYVQAVTAPLLIVILTSVTSITISVLALRIKDYYIAMDHGSFFHEEELKHIFDDHSKDNLGELLDYAININRFSEYCMYSKEEFNEKLAKIYLQAIMLNAKLNHKKSNYVHISQLVFFFGMFLLPIPLMILLIYYPR